MVERHPYKVKVSGSNPFAPTGIDASDKTNIEDDLDGTEIRMVKSEN